VLLNHNEGVAAGKVCPSTSSTSTLPHLHKVLPPCPMRPTPLANPRTLPTPHPPPYSLFAPSPLTPFPSAPTPHSATLLVCCTLAQGSLALGVAQVQIVGSLGRCFCSSIQRTTRSLPAAVWGFTTDTTLHSRSLRICTRHPTSQ
jgi:hypothetical protein